MQHRSTVSKRYKRLCTDPAVDREEEHSQFKPQKTHKSTRFAGPPAILSTRQSLPAIAESLQPAQSAGFSALALTSTPEGLSTSLTWSGPLIQAI